MVTVIRRQAVVSNGLVAGPAERDSWEGPWKMVRKEKSAAAAFVESAERVEWVELALRDGRVLQGNVIRNPIRQTGAIVNAVDETRVDFPIGDVLSVRQVEDPRLAVG